jgi:coenzyme F420 hydrogenase subunit beta
MNAFQGRPINNIDEIVKHGLCIGCGLCAYSDAIGKTRYSIKFGQFIPVIEETTKKDLLAYDLCPGKGYNIIEESKKLYDFYNYDLELGCVYNYYAAYSNDKQVLKNASSGGIISQIAIFLLEKSIVDRVLTTTYVYTDSGPRSKSILAKSKNEFLPSQGSKYSPVDLSEAIREIKNKDYKVAIIGTPCQIAGIRNIQKYDQSLGKKVVLTISNFCGGFKNYENISLIAKRKGIKAKDITSFRFRGGGQPGSMLIETRLGKEVKIPYPEYVGLNGLSKHLRCHLCVDATGELSDIACGDAWLDRFLQDINPWSIIITRNKKSDDLIKNLIEDDLITSEKISINEIKLSQNENLLSKKFRQKSRFYLYRKLGYKLPSFDGGYFDNELNIWIEVRVFLKHSLKRLLENLNLFYFFYKIYKKL